MFYRKSHFVAPHRESTNLLTCESNSVEDYREKLKNCVAIVDCFSLDSADCKTIAPILVK